MSADPWGHRKRLIDLCRRASASEIKRDPSTILSGTSLAFGVAGGSVIIREMILDAWAMNPGELPRGMQVLSRQRRYRIYRESVALFCAAALQSLNQPDRALSVVFVGVREMRSLNHRYLQRNYATDVLSFSYGEVMMDGMPFLGEIIIAPEVAVNQALSCKVSPEREIRRLLVHGILHLLGYDHETDRGQMNRLQIRLSRRKFFVNAPPLTGLKVSR